MEDVINAEFLLKIIAFLISSIIALIVYSWNKFEKKQDQVISSLSMFAEEFVSVKKDTEHLKQGMGEIKLEIRAIKQKVKIA